MTSIPGLSLGSMFFEDAKILGRRSSRLHVGARVLEIDVDRGANLDVHLVFRDTTCLCRLFADLLFELGDRNFTERMRQNDLLTGFVGADGEVFAGPLCGETIARVFIPGHGDFGVALPTLLPV